MDPLLVLVRHAVLLVVQMGQAAPLPSLVGVKRDWRESLAMKWADAMAKA
jgi:hypothetical protein